MHLHRLALAALAAAALSANVANNASAAPAAYNWSGFYMGLNAGGNWGTSQPSTSLTGGTFYGVCPNSFCSDIAAAGGQSFNTSGFTGGVQGGYNWQSGNLLAGIELDFQYFRSAGSKSISATYTGAPGFTQTETASISTDWLFTARPRLGMVASNWLFYGTGGLAVTRLKATWSHSDTFVGPSESASASATKAGWTVGGGIEAALPGNWLIGGEYLYVKFGSISATGAKAGFTDVFSHSIDLKSSIVRARFSKKF